jgi:hypothetical protein
MSLRLARVALLIVTGGVAIAGTASLINCSKKKPKYEGTYNSFLNDFDAGQSPNNNSSQYIYPVQGVNPPSRPQKTRPVSTITSSARKPLTRQLHNHNRIVITRKMLQGLLSGDMSEMFMPDIKKIKLSMGALMQIGGPLIRNRIGVLKVGQRPLDVGLFQIHPELNGRFTFFHLVDVSYRIPPGETPVMIDTPNGIKRLSSYTTMAIARGTTQLLNNNRNVIVDRGDGRPEERDAKIPLQYLSYPPKDFWGSIHGKRWTRRMCIEDRRKMIELGEMPSSSFNHGWRFGACGGIGGAFAFEVAPDESGAGFNVTGFLGPIDTQNLGRFREMGLLCRGIDYAKMPYYEDLRNDPGARPDVAALDRCRAEKITMYNMDPRIVEKMYYIYRPWVDKLCDSGSSNCRRRGSFSLRLSNETTENMIFGSPYFYHYTGLADLPISLLLVDHNGINIAVRNEGLMQQFGGIFFENKERVARVLPNQMALTTAQTIQDVGFDKKGFMHLTPALRMGFGDVCTFNPPAEDLYRFRQTIPDYTQGQCVDPYYNHPSRTANTGFQLKIIARKYAKLHLNNQASRAKGEEFFLQLNSDPSNGGHMQASAITVLDGAVSPTNRNVTIKLGYLMLRGMDRFLMPLLKASGRQLPAGLRMQDLRFDPKESQLIFRISNTFLQDNDVHGESTQRSYMNIELMPESRIVLKPTTIVLQGAGNRSGTKDGYIRLGKLVITGTKPDMGKARPMLKLRITNLKPKKPGNAQGGELDWVIVDKISRQVVNGTSDFVVKVTETIENGKMKQIKKVLYKKTGQPVPGHVLQGIFTTGYDIMPRTNFTVGEIHAVVEQYLGFGNETSNARNLGRLNRAVDRAKRKNKHPMLINLMGVLPKSLRKHFRTAWIKSEISRKRFGPKAKKPKISIRIDLDRQRAATTLLMENVPFAMKVAGRGLPSIYMDTFIHSLGVTIDCNKATKVCDIRMPKAAQTSRIDYRISAGLGSIYIPWHYGKIKILGNGLDARVDLNELANSGRIGLRRALWKAIKKFRLNAYVSGRGKVRVGRYGTMSGGVTLSNVHIGKGKLFMVLNPLISAMQKLSK